MFNYPLRTCEVRQRHYSRLNISVIYLQRRTLINVGDYSKFVWSGCINTSFQDCLAFLFVCLFVCLFFGLKTIYKNVIITVNVYIVATSVSIENTVNRQMQIGRLFSFRGAGEFLIGLNV